MTFLTRPFRILAFALAAQLLAAPAGAQAPGQMPPTGVSFVTLKARDIPLVSDLPGRIAPVRIAEVRSRVTGIIQNRVFEQGSLVKAGDVLYKIDPNLFRVRVASARASLQRAQATELNASQQFERQKVLRQRNASSDVEYESAAATLAQTQADVALAQAALDEAEINLGYTEVKAPISGVIGGALVTEGALVNADSGNPLATIQQIDPVYADFTQPAGDLLSIRRDIAAGRLAAPPSGGSVKLVFDDGSVHEKPGTLLFSSATVDSTTGQVTLRAEFPNPNRDLLPGLYVRIRIEQAIRKNALTVPQRAVLRDATGAATVFVVGAGNKAEARAVTLGPALEGDWLVIDGLKDGDKAVVEGGQKLQPGMEVAPEEWKPAAATDAAATQPAK
ncbi:MAG: efflux RND transporter periplasmic adaptor subunit [Rhizobiaceae bacterium]|nr:efflux RND transporter periplasmic adaptor subunit [Rhizobiaceae bacterium]